MRQRGNQECADCGEPAPEWASVNQGTTLCIACAGVHRSLGAHVSRVKSLRLDSWKPEELQQFLSQGGNLEVRRRKASSQPLGAAVRGATGAESNRPGAGKHGALAPSEDLWGALESSTRTGASASVPSSAGGSFTTAAAHMGRACHQGLVIVEVNSVELTEARAGALRMLGPLFLSLTVHLSLGPVMALPTTARRGSESVAWEPPERRELLWDAEERWLRCHVDDGGDFGGEAQIAGEGRVDLLRMLSQLGRLGCCGEGVTVNLYAPLDEDGDDDEDDSDEMTSLDSSRLARQDSDSSLDAEEPRRRRLCGSVELKITLIDMSGMHVQEKKSLHALAAM